MPIQFSCEACQQLIEVDDELLGQLAICPYCQATVRVPADTQKPAEPVPEPAPQAGPVPTSAPIAPQVFGIPATGPGSPYPIPPASLVGNRLGNWGLGLSLLGWLVMVLTAAYFAIQVAGSQLANGETAPTTEEVQQAMRDILEDAEKARIIAFGGGLMVVCALAGCVTSVLGIRKRDARKGTAIAGLVIGGTLLACQCVGAFGAVPGGL